MIPEEIDPAFAILPVGTFGPGGSSSAGSVLMRGALKEEPMAESTSLNDQTDQESAEARSDLLDRIDRTLKDWRAKIDELVVRLDLANLDLRDEVRKNLDATQNA